MDLAQVAEQLRLPNAEQLWGETWSRSESTFPREGIAFLDAEAVARTCDELRLREPLKQAFLDALPALRTDPAMTRLLWHWHDELFLAREPVSADPPQRWFTFVIPPPEHGLAARMFYGFVLLSGVPWLRRLYASRGIPESVLIDTLSDIEVWANDYRCQHGHWGFTAQLWLLLHFSGKVFRLGRLQFEPTKVSMPFHAYRRRGSGEIAILAGGDQKFRADGQFANADGLEAPDSWTSAFSTDDRSIHGHRVSPRGAVSRDAVTLSRAEWEPALEPGDAILNVHIPATGPMDYAACLDSFNRAGAFFATHFPEHDWKAFTCYSWLMDPQLADHLPPESNVVRFLREFHLHPLPGAAEKQTLERVFGGPGCDHARTGKETSLQRAVRKHMEAGGKWRGGSGVRLRRG